MKYLRANLSRLRGSALVWSWGVNGLRLASAVLLLPLLLRFLPEADLGFHYALLGLAAIGPLLDFGLAVSIERGVSYAMGGAQLLQPHGVAAEAAADGQPNYPLLWRLLYTTRVFYRVLALAMFTLLGVIGTLLLGGEIRHTSQPEMAWLAWGATLGSTVFDLYSSWWNVFLRGMNHVVAHARITFIGYGLKVLLACALLLLGGGLLSVPLAGIVGALFVRWSARNVCLKVLTAHPSPRIPRSEIVSMLSTLWPNAWRAGLQISSGYLSSNANMLVCVKTFGLAANAEYGLSFQIANILQGMASVWTNVKWPMVGQYRARRDYPALRRLLWPRLWLQNATFLLLAVCAYEFGPLFLELLGSGKRILPAGWFLLLLLNAFLETQNVFWTTLLATENRIPSLRAVVTTNIASFLLVLALIQFTQLGLGCFVLAPLVTGALFNYWFWARQGAKSLQTTWLRFTLSRPA